MLNQILTLQTITKTLMLELLQKLLLLAGAWLLRPVLFMLNA